MSRLAIALIRAYQRLVSPLLGPCCRFYPSCSAYACECIARHGVWRGGLFTLRRLGRCHPWHPGGVDLPPPVDQHRGALAPCPASNLENG